MFGKEYVCMPSAGARGCKGVWGLSPRWGPGAKPLVRGSGDEVPQKQTIFSSLNRWFLMNYYITF